MDSVIEVFTFIPPIYYRSTMHLVKGLAGVMRKAGLVVGVQNKMAVRLKRRWREKGDST